MQKRSAEFVASFKPGSRFIVKSDYLDLNDPENLVVKGYSKAISYNRECVNKQLFPFYKRNLGIPDSKLGETIIKIKAIVRETGLTMEELAKEISDYLGYEVSFFRICNGKQVPVESDRLLRAHKGIVGEHSKAFVENVLFKN